MKAKAFLLTALLAGSALTASADNGFRFGVTAGMNVPNITNSDGDCRIGFNVGVRGEYNFTNNLYVNGAFLFTQKGNEYEYGVTNISEVTGKVKNNPGYLEIPLALGYRFDLGNHVYLFGETGPYFAFGVCGKQKLDVESSLVNYNKKEDFFSDNKAQTFDGGWGLRLGVEASGFQVHLGYEYGFSKIWDTNGDGNHNSNFNVGVSYMF